VSGRRRRRRPKSVRRVSAQDTVMAVEAPAWRRPGQTSQPGPWPHLPSDPL